MAFDPLPFTVQYNNEFDEKKEKWMKTKYNQTTVNFPFLTINDLLLNSVEFPFIYSSLVVLYVRRSVNCEHSFFSLSNKHSLIALGIVSDSNMPSIMVIIFHRFWWLSDGSVNIQWQDIYSILFSWFDEPTITIILIIIIVIKDLRIVGWTVFTLVPKIYNVA